MAFFNRGIVTSYPLLNSFCCSNKLFTDVRMLKMCRQSVKPVLSRNIFSSRKPPVKKKYEDEMNAHDFVFEKMLERRKKQAKCSILVQVNSLSSHNPLYKYCSQFGQILNMYYYDINKEEHYLLVEFPSQEIVNEILSAANFLNGKMLVPIRTTTLWFSSKKEALYMNSNPIDTKKIVSPNVHINNDNSQCTDKQLEYALQKSATVSDQIMCLFEKLKLSELEVRLRFYIVAQFEEILSKTFCNASILPFGSSVNGFGKHGCDLDLVLLLQIFENPSNGMLTFHSKVANLEDKYGRTEFMSTVSRIMSQFMPGIRNVKEVLHARVPIIKFDHRYTDIECDLSVNSMLGVYMSDLLYVYGLIDSRIRPIIFTIRTWARKHKLTRDQPGPYITNFSLSLLVLFYLQGKNVIPSLNNLKRNATCEDIRYSKRNIDCTFLRDVRHLRLHHISPNKETLQSLLVGFFQFYSMFDFETRAICIREGKVKPKEDHVAIYIINPFEQSVNVCQNVTVLELNHILLKVRETLKQIQNNSQWNLLHLLKYSSSDSVITQKSINLSPVFNKPNVQNSEDILFKKTKSISDSIPIMKPEITEKPSINMNDKVNSVIRSRKEGIPSKKTGSILEPTKKMYDFK